jgi:hypothetical protein
VTQAHPAGEPGAVKSEFAVMVIAACCPLPALAAIGMLTATATAKPARKTERRIDRSLDYLREDTHVPITTAEKYQLAGRYVKVRL